MSRMAHLTRDDVIAIASIMQRPYPQYRGYWNGPEWRLVKFRQNVTTKMGDQFLAGDVTLARPYMREKIARWEAYSLRGHVHVAVHSEDITIIDDRDREMWEEYEYAGRNA